jgi:hypothetical protein
MAGLFSAQRIDGTCVKTRTPLDVRHIECGERARQGSRSISEPISRAELARNNELEREPMKTRNISTFAISSAVAGILAGAALSAGCSGNASAATKTADKTEHNGCNGKNGCSAGKETKDKNSCKGHSGCSASGEKKDKNSCGGANGCSSKEKN